MTVSDCSPREAAAYHAELGLPVPRGTRLRFFKRILARLGRLVIHRQVAFNHAVVSLVDERDAVVGSLQSSFERQRGALSAAETRIGNDIGSLRSDLHRVHRAALEAQALTGSVREELQTSDAKMLETRLLVEHVSTLAQELRVRLDAMEQAQRAQHALVDLFLREVRRDYPAKPKRKRLAKLPAGADDLYAALEDTFRGPPEVITEWQRPYLADVEPVAHDGRVLDVGSGRGEWLSLLRDAGIDGYGVERNQVAIEACRARGLDVVHDDVFRHLAALGDRSLSVISAFHVMEHLAFEDLLLFLDQAVRVLRPGGLLIVETPNPTNVLMGSSNFFLDPTHEKPLHPRLLEFLLASRGFGDVEVRYLHPAPDALETADGSEAARKTVEPVLQRLNVLFFGAQDYAVLARRAPR